MRHPAPGRGPLSLETLEAALRFARKWCWHVYLSCAGEPLLHPRFVEAMELAAKLLPGTDITLATNGYLLDRERSKAICRAGVSSVIVSVDTVDAARYASLTGGRSPDALGRVQRNVASLVKTREQRTYPKVVINAVIMRSTLAGLSDVVEWAAEVGADGVRLLWLLPTNEEFTQKQVLVPDGQTVAAVEKLQRAAKAKGLYFDVPDLGGIRKHLAVLAGAKQYRNTMDYLCFNARKFTRMLSGNVCRAAGFTFLVSRDGLVTMCPEEKLVLGSVSELADTDVHRTVAESIRHNPPECRQCRYFTPRLSKGTRKT